MQLCHWHSANGVTPILLARLAGFDLTASKHQGRRPRIRKARAVAAQHKDDSGDVRSLIGVILHAEQCNVDASQDLSNRAWCSYHWINQLRSLVFVPLPPCLKMFVSKHQAATHNISAIPVCSGEFPQTMVIGQAMCLHILQYSRSPHDSGSSQPSFLWWSPRSGLQSHRRQTWLRKCLPLRIQETCSHCKTKFNIS